MKKITVTKVLHWTDDEAQFTDDEASEGAEVTKTLYAREHQRKVDSADWNERELPFKCLCRSDFDPVKLHDYALARLVNDRCRYDLLKPDEIEFTAEDIAEPVIDRKYIEQMIRQESEAMANHCKEPVLDALVVKSIATRLLHSADDLLKEKQ